MQNLALTGITGILIGAIAFSSKPSTSQSSLRQAQDSAAPALSLIQAEKSRRLTIAVSVSTMTDRHVTEGQTLQSGEPNADRTLDRPTA
jgi:hypothetical protein